MRMRERLIEDPEVVAPIYGCSIKRLGMKRAPR
jgi:hypothetical protein